MEEHKVTQIRNLYGNDYPVKEPGMGALASLRKLCKPLFNWRFKLVTKEKQHAAPHHAMGLYTYKYVRFHNGVIVFPPNLQHRDMSELCPSLGRPISGGFVSKNEQGLIECHGRSISLRLGAQPDDTEVLNQHLSR
ncbi:MAG: hypothetical protein H7A51_08275 [Akkermansiaceae bacterium]|nr:hypothetical protein [Akkermansiaceae bacterium]